MTLQKVENLENNTAKLTIAVEAEAVEKELNNAYLKRRKNINVQGFRKGKAPRKLIEKMYGEGIFFDDAANALINETYPDAATESKLEIVAQPDIEVVQMESGKEFIYTAVVVLKPEVTLGDYKGLEVTKVDTSVTEEEVDAELERVRKQNGRSIEVTDRPVASGDETVIDFEGFVDGVAFDGGKGEDYPLTIGSGQFIPGFEDQLVGAEIGKEVEVNVTFPEEYHSEDLAGKDAVFKCTVKSIKVKELPELDDEFASDVSEFETLEEYKKDLFESLVKTKESKAKETKENEVVEALVKVSKMDIPEKMIDAQVRNMANEFAQRLQAQGLSIDQYMKYTGMNNDSLFEQMRPEALKRIKSRLVLEAVVAAENITASEEDFQKQVDEMAKAYNMEVDKIKELLGEKEKENMMSDLAVNKALDFLVENAKEVEKAEETTEE